MDFLFTVVVREFADGGYWAFVKDASGQIIGYVEGIMQNKYDAILVAYEQIVRGEGLYIHAIKFDYD